MSAARKHLTNSRRSVRPSRPYGRAPSTPSRSPPLLGLGAPPGLLRPPRPRAPPRVWASRWRLAWRAGPVTSSLLSLPFSSPVPSSTGLPDSLLFARRRPRSTAAQSAPFVYRVVFLSFESASHYVVALVSFDLVANLVIFLLLTPPPKSREYRQALRSLACVPVRASLLFYTLGHIGFA